MDRCRWLQDGPSKTAQTIRRGLRLAACGLRVNRGITRALCALACAGSTTSATTSELLRESDGDLTRSEVNPTHRYRRPARRR